MVRRKHSQLRGQDRINRRVGREANRKKVEKHFEIIVTDDDLRWSRKRDRIAAEAELDGVYVVRTSLDAAALGSAEAVESYKNLAQVERVFRSLKTTQLQVWPVFIYTEQHVRGHVFLCMLAYYVEWHLRQRWEPLLFGDDDREGPGRNGSPLSNRRRSPRAPRPRPTPSKPRRVPRA